MVLESGTFSVGCNYWASHAGCFMWRNWDASVVESDLERLEKIGVKMLRIFPLWPDFQPLVVLRGQGGVPRALARRDDEPLASDGSTVEPEMLLRLRFVCDCAARHGMKLIVSLVTGWMSGRLFVPAAFEERNLLTDPEVVFYETRLVREIVSFLADHEAVVIWEPGNECNCMAECSRPAARLWLETIVGAIRLADSSRPVAAGMHGLTPAAADSLTPEVKWRIGDVGAACDLLTTHPYPLFTPHAATDRVGSFKSLFHATAESRFYADLSGKGCFVEELGTLSGVTAGEKTAGKYLSGTLLNLFFHDCRALLWWCAFDQAHIGRPPYRWCAVERELGLFREDGSLKPVGGELRDFEAFRSKLPEQGRFPGFRRDAAVIITSPEAAWSSGWGAFLLAKQAHFDVEFCYADQPLPEYDLYIVPSVDGCGGITPELFNRLLRRAEEGATIFISSAGGPLSPFETAFGVESDGYDTPADGITQVKFGSEELSFHDVVRQRLLPTDAVIATGNDDGGTPFFFRRRVGAGELCYFAFPLEREVATMPGACEQGYYRIYESVAEKVLSQRPITVAAPHVSVTIHPAGENRMFAAFVNNGRSAEIVTPQLRNARIVGIFPAERKNEVELQPGQWRVFELVVGDEESREV